MIIAANRKKRSDAPVLPELLIWNDATARDGPANMAVDEWLWKHHHQPLLRIYRWLGDWISIGYFSKCSSAPEHRNFVRRPTGGGLVDHRADWTYTLIIPRGFPLAEMPGAASYEIIHRALGEVLAQEKIECHLMADQETQHSDFCFQQPVRFDLVDAQGRKLAGAGQRRGTQGLLHQGSVQAPQNPHRGHALACHLASSVREAPIALDGSAIERMRKDIYLSPSWNQRR